MSLLIDLDRLDIADRQSPLFGVTRPALYSFCEADHGARYGTPLPRSNPGPENACNTGLATGQSNDYTTGALSAVGRKPAAQSALVW
jgi:hypothetical protein